MKKSPTKLPFRDAVLAYCKYFSTRFGLDNVYDIDIYWLTDPHPEEPSVLASVIWDTRYLRTAVKIYPLLEKTYNDGHTDQFIEAMTHEFCHFFTFPLYDKLIDYVPPSLENFIEELNEQITQRITRAIISTVPTNLMFDIPAKRTTKRTKALGR